MELALAPGEDGSQRELADLSDGLKSLFYFALSLSLFDLERRISQGASAADGFDASRLRLPVLTIFAIEEPENHLSPHYLGTVVRELRRAAEEPAGQVILASHSPAILNRVEPKEVRYLRWHDQQTATEARPIKLPDPEDDAEAAFKYINSAVRAFPELYFAQVAVLCEGPSEEVVLPRLLEAHDLPADRTFVSVVPLGGRHVHHFWQLLADLDIPTLTLVDLDWGRIEGGWKRIHDLSQCLLQYRVGEDDFFRDAASAVTPEVLANMPERRCDDEEGLDEWIEHLASFNVFVSYYLDLDWSMMEAFPDAYRSASGSGPRIPVEGGERRERWKMRQLRRLLGEFLGASELEAIAERDYAPEWAAWYNYLFLDRSKPATHFQALLEVEDEQLRNHAPDALTELVSQIKKLVATGAEAGGDG
jgi:hypothetical protein